LGIKPMSRNNRNLLLAAVVSITLTAGLFVCAYAASRSHEGVARVLYWQGYLLPSLVPAVNIGTSEHPLYEASPVHVVAFFAGIPLGFIVYFLLSLAGLKFTTGSSGVAQQALPGDARNART